LYAVSLVQKSADCLSLDVTCSHGTYIRSLGEYIASRLKTCGHLSQLRRVAYYHDSRPYDNPVATLDALIQDPAQYVVTLSDLPKYLPSYDLPLTELRSFLTGKWRRASLKLEGWWLVQVAQRSIGVVFFENGKVTQRLFMPQKNAAITIPQIAVPHKCSRYD
jgi:tRNA pseudouridine55 synthase